MYHIIYKTTNLINDKIYIGYHLTDDLNDSYLGSGRNLKKAIEKYGKDNFKRNILYVFPTKEEALLKEAEIVNEDFLKRDDVYNLKEGGEGGWNYINKMIKEDPEFKENFYKNHSKIIKDLFESGKLKGWKKHDTFKGKKHSNLSKKRISENNGNKLDSNEYSKRIKDYNSIDKSRGYIGKLSKKWGISHTQVRRFIDKLKMQY